VSPGVRNTVLLCIAFAALVIGAFVSNVMRDPLLDEEALREQGTFVLPEPRALSLAGLVDQTGAPFDESDLVGHWSFVFFGFTSCPDVCPVALAALAQVEKKLADAGNAELHDQFRGVFVSVDPDRDDVAKISAYASAFSPRFLGVTGDQASLAAFATQVNAAFMKVPGQGADYLIDHTANIVVINPRGHYHAFIRLPHEPDKILLAYRSIAAAF
jgi:protein SCO1/2